MFIYDTFVATDKCIISLTEEFKIWIIIRLLATILVYIRISYTPNKEICDFTLG